VLVVMCHNPYSTMNRCFCCNDNLFHLGSYHGHCKRSCLITICPAKDAAWPAASGHALDILMPRRPPGNNAVGRRQYTVSTRPFPSANTLHAAFRRLYIITGWGPAVRMLDFETWPILARLLLDCSCQHETVPCSVGRISKMPKGDLHQLLPFTMTALWGAANPHMEDLSRSSIMSRKGAPVGTALCLRMPSVFTRPAAVAAPRNSAASAPIVICEVVCIHQM
jgi:hypothetical protein